MAFLDSGDVFEMKLLVTMDNSNSFISRLRCEIVNARNDKTKAKYYPRKGFSECQFFRGQHVKL
jgi:hypothetical protein